MQRIYLFLLSIIILVACQTTTPLGDQPDPTEDTPITDEPITNDLIAEPDWSFIDALDPDTILVQLDFVPTYSIIHYMQDYGRPKTLTLYADGRIIYLGSTTELQTPMFEAQLTPEERTDFLHGLWEQGYGDLTSHTSDCGEDENGDEICIADDAFTVLNVRLSAEEVRTTENYGSFADNPDALLNVKTFLTSFTHPDADLYIPSQAALFRTAIDYSGDPEAIEGLSWEFQTPEALMGDGVAILSADQITEFMEITGINNGYIVVKDGDSYVAVTFVPWLPSEDYTETINALSE